MDRILHICDVDWNPPQYQAEHRDPFLQDKEWYLRGT